MTSTQQEWDDRARLDHAWKIRSDQQDMIKFADQKLAALAALSAIVDGFVLTNLRGLLDLAGLMWLGVVVFAVVTFWFIVAVLRGLFARAPGDVSPPVTDGSADTLPRVVYFGHISRKPTAESYSLQLAALSASEMLRDVAHQNWELAKIASAKYRFYRQAWLWLLVQLAVFLILAVLWACMRPIVHPPKF